MYFFLIALEKSAGKGGLESALLPVSSDGTPQKGVAALKFVYFDEKTLKTAVNPLAFCALLLYNNANLL